MESHKSDSPDERTAHIAANWLSTKTPFTWEVGDYEDLTVLFVDYKIAIPELLARHLESLLERAPKDVELQPLIQHIQQCIVNIQNEHFIWHPSAINALANAAPKGLRSTKGFRQGDSLLPKEASGEMSHAVKKAYKRPGVFEDKTKEKFKHLWLHKVEEDRIIAEREVVAQELFRLLSSHHPKTRLVIDNKHQTYVASKFLEDTQPLGKLKADAVKDKLLKGEYTGLGSITVIALLLNEIDLKLGNIVVDKHGQLIKFDGDWCFASLRYSLWNKKFPINSKIIDALPCCSDYEAYNWIDYRGENIIEKNPKIASPASPRLSDSTIFRCEVNKTILKCLLLPDELIHALITHHVSDKKEISLIADFIKTRQQMLRSAALHNKRFLVFLLEDASILNLVKEFSTSLNQFRLTGKTLLTANFKDKHTHKTLTLRHITEAYFSLMEEAKETFKFIAETTPSSTGSIPTSPAPSDTPKILPSSPSHASTPKSPAADRNLYFYQANSSSEERSTANSASPKEENDAGSSNDSAIKSNRKT